MADISRFTDQIQNAPRGEVVRDSIIGSIKEMATKGITAKQLSGQPVTKFCTFKECSKAFITGKLKGRKLYDDKPYVNSKKTVESKGLYNIFKDIHQGLNKILDIEETWK